MDIAKKLQSLVNSTTLITCKSLFGLKNRVKWT